MIKKTIRIEDLILQDLLEENKVDAATEARKWGEDMVRCWNLLEKFRKRGLAKNFTVSPGKSRNFPKIKFSGNKEKIKEYMNSNNSIGS